jgi:hypothetical protein
MPRFKHPIIQAECKKHGTCDHATFFKDGRMSYKRCRLCTLEKRRLKAMGTVIPPPEAVSGDRPFLCQHCSAPLKRDRNKRYCSVTCRTQAFLLKRKKTNGEPVHKIMQGPRKRVAVVYVTRPPKNRRFKSYVIHELKMRPLNSWAVIDTRGLQTPESKYIAHFEIEKRLANISRNVMSDCSYLVLVVDSIDPDALKSMSKYLESLNLEGRVITQVPDWAF